jgi:RNA recognition motif-containing protein
MNTDFLFYGSFAAVLIFSGLIYWMASIKQRQFSNQANQLLGLQKANNDQLGNILKELRRHSKLLAEIIDEAANSPAYEDESLEHLQEEEAGIIDISRKIYIGNLEYSTTETELMDLFQEYGTIESVNIPLNRYNGRARGFGFVTFENEADAERAIEMNGQEFKSRALQVNFAKERD